jgi:peptide/nickel transport system substrate-binding protein
MDSFIVQLIKIEENIMKPLQSSPQLQKSFYTLGILLILAAQLSLTVRPTQAAPEPSNQGSGQADKPADLATPHLQSTPMIGCAPAPGTGPIPFPSGGKTATTSFFQEPDLVDALFSGMYYSYLVDQSIQVGLATWDASNNFIPELAAEIPTTANGGISTDGLTITWHLKPCLYWSDGEPLTSADVKFTWQVVMDPGNTVYTRIGYDQIESIDIPDVTTVVLHFKSLYPGWQTLFTHGTYNWGNLQPKHILEGKTGLESDPFIHWPTISSGPWVITDWVAGDHMTLLPNPNYWKGHPKLDQIQIKFIPDPDTAKAALQAGTVNLVPDFAENEVANLPALEPAIHMRAVDGPDFEHYFFNLGVKGTGVGQSDYEGFCPFKNVDVRKAMILGIDRQTIVDTLLFGKTTVPATLWPNSSWTNTSLIPYPYDPDQAKTLLENAGYTPGIDGIRHGMCNSVDTKLSFNFETTTKQLRQDMAAAVQTMLLGIGVEFKPVFTLAGTFFGDYASGANMATGNYDMAGYTTGIYRDPYTDVFLCSTVPSNQNQGGYNNYHLCDPNLDTLFEQSNSSADPIARKVYFDQIQQYMYDNALVIPIYARISVMAYVDRFILPPTSSLNVAMGETFDWDIKPGAFSKTSPVNGATGQPANPTLSWGTSSDASSYQYCIDTTNDSTCNTTWTSTGMNTSVALSGLSSGTYYWAVRSKNTAGTVVANKFNGVPWWSFIVSSSLPGAFNKISPTNGATGQPSNPTLSWGTSSGATSYQYCIDTANDNTCNTTWTSTGTNKSVALSGLSSGKYYWAVRSKNTAGTVVANKFNGLPWWSFTVTSALPGAFSKISPANGIGGQPSNPTLTWGASSGATSYQYCIDMVNDNVCGASWISAGTNLSAALNSLIPGKYYWAVRSKNASGTVVANKFNGLPWWSFTVP